MRVRVSESFHRHYGLKSKSRVFDALCITDVRQVLIKTGGHASGEAGHGTIIKEWFPPYSGDDWIGRGFLWVNKDEYDPVAENNQEALRFLKK